MPTPLDLVLLNSMARAGGGLSPELLAQLAQTDPQTAAYLASIQQNVPVRESAPTPPTLPPITPMQGAMTAAGKVGEPAFNLAQRYLRPPSTPATPPAMTPLATANPLLYTQGFTDPRFGNLVFPTRADPAMTLGYPSGVVPPGSEAIGTGGGDVNLISTTTTQGAAEGALEGGGSAAAGSAATATPIWTSGAGGVSSALPYVGAAYNIASEAAAGKKPADQQAIDAAMSGVGAYFAPATFGLSMLAAQLAQQDLNRVYGPLKQGNIMPALENSIPLVAPIQDIGEWFGADIFGMNTPPRQKVSLPGLTKTLDQTAGGAKTTFKSYNEGIGGAEAFGNAIQNALTVDDLVKAMNQQYSPFPGQFEILGQGPKGGIANVPLSVNYPNVGFTAADLANPDLVNSLKVNAGVLGAPAPQDALTQALIDRIKFATQRSQGAPGAAGGTTSTPSGSKPPATSIAPDYLTALAAGVA